MEGEGGRDGVGAEAGRGQREEDEEEGGGGEGRRRFTRRLSACICSLPQTSILQDHLERS